MAVRQPRDLSKAESGHVGGSACHFSKSAPGMCIVETILE
jgi:hypothetical protein